MRGWTAFLWLLFVANCIDQMNADAIEKHSLERCFIEARRDHSRKVRAHFAALDLAATPTYKRRPSPETRVSGFLATRTADDDAFTNQYAGVYPWCIGTMGSDPRHFRRRLLTEPATGSVL